MNYFNKLARFFIIPGLIIIFIFFMAPFLKADEAEEVISNVTSKPQPNLVLNVKRQSGTCPQKVGLWVLSFGYINIAAQSNQIVIADTLSVAGASELVSEKPRLVEYKAPLRKAYKNCIGTAIYPLKSQPEKLEANYKFDFKNGQVRFTTKLNDLPDDAGIGFGITDTKIVGLRPYLQIDFID